jgi:hypothetical protein
MSLYTNCDSFNYPYIKGWENLTFSSNYSLFSDLKMGVYTPLFLLESLILLFDPLSWFYVFLSSCIS